MERLRMNREKKTKAHEKSAQSQRFIDAAREAGCSEDEAVFDENLKRITRLPPKAKTPAKQKT